MRLIDADALDTLLKDAQTECKRNGGNFRFGVLNNIRENIAKMSTIGGWIPFVKRPLTDDEKNTHPDWCYILEGSVPEDEEEILLYRPWKNTEGYIITMDQYMNNGTECYLDGAGDIENGMFWMTLPEPPKEAIE